MVTDKQIQADYEMMLRKTGLPDTLDAREEYFNSVFIDTDQCVRTSPNVQSRRRYQSESEWEVLAKVDERSYKYYAAESEQYPGIDATHTGEVRYARIGGSRVQEHRYSGEELTGVLERKAREGYLALGTNQTGSIDDESLFTSLYEDIVEIERIFLDADGFGGDIGDLVRAYFIETKVIEEDHERETLEAKYKTLTTALYHALGHIDVEVSAIVYTHSRGSRTMGEHSMWVGCGSKAGNELYILNLVAAIATGEYQSAVGEHNLILNIANYYQFFGDGDIDNQVRISGICYPNPSASCDDTEEFVPSLTKTNLENGLKLLRQMGTLDKVTVKVEYEKEDEDEDEDDDGDGGDEYGGYW